MHRKIAILKAVLNARIFRQYTPLITSINLTNRCNLDCSYCGYPHLNDYEMTSTEVLDIIAQLNRLGTQRINITGGEPTLRKDLDRIIDAIIAQNMTVNVNTNGLLIKDKLEMFKKINNVTISLDGFGDYNLKSRGIDSAKVVEAIELCVSHQIPVTLSTVLNKYNLNEIDALLEFSRQRGISVAFQPSLTTQLTGGKHSTAPEPGEYKKAVSRIVDYKRSGKYKIFNSLSGLRYLYHWPESTDIPCWAGKLLCRIEANGMMYPCSRVKVKSADCLRLGVNRAFKEVSTESCRNCWCAGLVEFNLFASMNFDVIKNMLSVVNN